MQLFYTHKTKLLHKLKGNFASVKQFYLLPVFYKPSWWASCNFFTFHAFVYEQQLSK